MILFFKWYCVAVVTLQMLSFFAHFKQFQRFGRRTSSVKSHSKPSAIFGRQRRQLDAGVLSRERRNNNEDNERNVKGRKIILQKAHNSTFSAFSSQSKSQSQSQSTKTTRVKSIKLCLSE